MTRYEFRLTLDEAEQLREALCVQLRRARDVHHRSRDEHISKALSLLDHIERQVRDIERFEEECARRAKQPEYLVGI
jgi:hypothetical protein